MIDNGTREAHPSDQRIRETIAAIETYVELWPAFTKPFGRVAGTRRPPGRPNPALQPRRSGPLPAEGLR